MTKFILIEPAMKVVRNLDCEWLDNALASVGLKVNEVDHGMITRHLAIVVAEHGMFAQPDAQAYTAINGHLYAGNAVVYAVDERGATVDAMEAHAFASACTFLLTRQQVENAISRRLVLRPQLSAGGVVIWQWPQPEPKGARR